jgi:hypothetical protein
MKIIIMIFFSGWVVANATYYDYVKSFDKKGLSYDEKQEIKELIRDVLDDCRIDDNERIEC